MGAVKRIKCPYCEHTGQSVLEESTPILAYLLSFALYLLIGFYAILLMPCIAGILRDQRHRCPKCHNEIKEDSIFSGLDDNIISFNFGTFGVLITRRTLIKTVIFILCVGLATFAWDIVVEGPTWYLEGRDVDTSLTWNKFVNECGHQTNLNTLNREFDSKFKNRVIEWEGRVLRVDGDHYDDDEDPVLQIDNEKHYHTHSSAEIFIRMDPAMRGIFYSSDYDLLLTLDSEHFLKNRDALDQMRVGSDIKFKGFLRNLGKGSDRSKSTRQRQYQKSNDKAEDEMLMPMFTVFELEVVRQFDELPTEGYNRKGHHHLHKNVRYSINTEVESDTVSTTSN